MATKSAEVPSRESASLVKVWDPLVRIGHWLLVLGFFIAYLTEDDFLTVHVWAGYLVAAVTSFRVVWGLVGPTHARFTDFAYSPRAIVRYVVGLFSRSTPRYLGHSPAGGAMVFALLIGLAATGFSGLMLYAIEENAGPFAELMAAEATFPAIVSTAWADEDEHEVDEDREEWWEELHEFFANFTLVLVGFHVGGVLLASFVHKENLVKSMFTGKKRSS